MKKCRPSLYPKLALITWRPDYNTNDVFFDDRTSAAAVSK